MSSSTQSIKNSQATNSSKYKVSKKFRVQSCRYYKEKPQENKKFLDTLLCILPLNICCCNCKNKK